MTRPLRIHRVRGRDLRDALERAGRLHGTHALVLGHEPAPGGGVTVAVGLARQEGALPGAASASAAASTPSDAARERGLRDVGRVLRRAGASDALVERVLAAVSARGAAGAFALDAAAAALEDLVPIAPSPRIARGALAGEGAPARCVLAFVGPTGVGKTTTLVKLAARLVQAGRRVALATMDTHRTGAVEQLALHARALQVPVEVARDGADLGAAVERAGDRDAVLVDTTGRSPRDVAALQELARALGRGASRAAGLEVYLTLSATASRAALEEAQLGFDAARPSALVVTKLDETRQPAPALEHAARVRLPLAFLTDGQDVAAHLHRPRPGHFADLLLRGRLS